MRSLFVTVIPKYMNSATFFKDDQFVLYYVCSQDMNIYVACSAFNSRPGSLLVTNKASVFFLPVWTIFVGWVVQSV